MISVKKTNEFRSSLLGVTIFSDKEGRFFK